MSSPSRIEPAPLPSRKGRGWGWVREARLRTPCFDRLRRNPPLTPPFPGRGSRGTLAALALLLPLLALSACDREQRDMAGQPKAETQAFVAKGDPRAAEYGNNAFHIAQGQRLFAWFNCSGCHSHGGGGMGPPLMDNKWRYGGKMEDIVASILYGRPNGMPDWRNKITQQQAWELAAYVHSLSGAVRKDAVSARSDEMAVTPQQSLGNRPHPVDEGQAPPPPGEPK